ncbi:MAG TPA: hypothetical protein VFP71_14375 [Candidatus Angelobacter sp.]|nr:hypothetical protein [Candidatus Angelobacter sp.]
MADTNNLKTWQEAAAATKDCLPLEVLERFTEEAPADAKAAAHLESCAHCQTELSMLKDFEAATPSADEGAAVAWIAVQLQRQQLGGSAKPTIARVSFWRNLLRVPYMAGAAAMIAVLVLAISLHHPEPGQPRLGGPSNIGLLRSGEVKLLSPTTSDLAQPPNEFRWEAVQGAASYKIDLMDALDKPLASATSSQPQIETTPEMKAAMQARMPIKWKVTALDSSGKTIAESSGGSFKIK